jgi:hypothetical protein
MPAKKTKEQFIENSIKIHGNKYDYSKVEYVSNKHKVCVTCPLHGEFMQTPNDHIGGHGCRKCSEENHSNYNMKDSLLPENKNKPIDLYIINLKSNDESFIKVGISKEVHKRHRNIKTKSGYEVSSFLVFPCTVEEGTIIEKNILSSLRKLYKYNPFVKFPGYKECLTLSAKQDILEKLKEILSETYHRSDLVGKILQIEYGK